MKLELSKSKRWSNEHALFFSPTQHHSQSVQGIL